MAKPQTLNDMLQIYLDNARLVSTTRDNSLEFEVKFGTKNIKRITKIDYDNVIQYLLSSGFTSSPEQYKLRIFNEFVDPKTGVTKLSHIRTELSGIGNISRYCKNNNIVDETGNTLASFEQKNYFRKDAETFYPLDVDKYNFRVSMQQERMLSENSGVIKSIIDKWSDTKKVFRYMCRNTFRHPDYPLKVDMSIVKSSKRSGRHSVPEYQFVDSGLLESPEQYEIEIELDHTKIKQDGYDNPDILGGVLRKVIKLVLSGLQGTNFPISYLEQREILEAYMTVLWGDKHQHGNRILPRNFVGPSQYTLQINNIVPINSISKIPNIRKHYTVTEKADGDRKLLYIAGDGKMYFITTNMTVEFTGAFTSNKLIHNTIIDGEHIKVNKKGAFINLYAAFDLYYLNRIDVRELAFAPTDEDDAKQKKGDDKEVQTQYRLLLLSQIINNLDAKSVTSVGKKTMKDKSPVRFETKTFYQDSKSQSIFGGCALIMQKVADEQFEYETDGLIFTPSAMGVGSNEVGKTTEPIKRTWEHSFKWKPPEFNTIDFLVTTKKAKDGNEEISNIFQGGTNTSAVTQLSQYKTLILRVGYDEKKHGYINPCQNVIDGDLPNVKDKDNINNYRPVQFFPSNPVDDDAGLTNIMLQNASSGEKIMLTEDGQVIEDNTIVEFKYELDNKKLWKWVPIRVRYDKTAAFRNGEKNYGNAYHVADSNWYSIHNPITVAMITSGSDIPDELANDDIYYNAVGNDTQTRALRDFHNLFVKKALITNTSRPGDTLIDLAVGKGGDFSKWIAAKLKFVFGIDISRDNIQNRLNGACARYLNYKKKFSEVPAALFVNGNSSSNIRNGDAIYSDKGKQITKAVFGQGGKDRMELGDGVFKLFGYGEEGFNICSIQFAIHYMFEGQQGLQNFLRNVSETTKVGGYFIGTSYDGKEIFNLLRDKTQGESVSIIQNGEKIWSITKQYDRDTFDDEDSSVGFAIDVYQESINKTFREYLVNYTYLTRLLENYGFALLPVEEAIHMNLPSGSGMFSELFNLMNTELKRKTKSRLKYGSRDEYGAAPKMTSGEKKISFLNRYFVYKKIRDVDAEKVAYDLLGVTKSDEKEATVADDVVQEIVSEVEQKLADDMPKAADAMLKAADDIPNAADDIPNAADDIPNAAAKKSPTKKAVTKKKRKLVLKKKS
jgi:hypothetical protein